MWKWKTPFREVGDSGEFLFPWRFFPACLSSRCHSGIFVLMHCDVRTYTRVNNRRKFTTNVLVDSKSGSCSHVGRSKVKPLKFPVCCRQWFLVCDWLNWPVFNGPWQQIRPPSGKNVILKQNVCLFVCFIVLLVFSSSPRKRSQVVVGRPPSFTLLTS